MKNGYTKKDNITSSARVSVAVVKIRWTNDSQTTYKLSQTHTEPTTAESYGGWTRGSGSLVSHWPHCYQWCNCDSTVMLLNSYTDVFTGPTEPSCINTRKRSKSLLSKTPLTNEITKTERCHGSGLQQRLLPECNSCVCIYNPPPENHLPG